MGNPFGTEEMAEGYARSRPAVHRRVIERVWAVLGRGAPFERALDVGCGAGISTKALEGYARRAIGLEPAEGMLRWGRAIAPQAEFVAGAAEALPMGSHTVDLITAAGSLNYADAERFFAEAARVLRPGGVLLVYDFSAGRSFGDSAALDEWFEAFGERYPAPANEARSLDPETLDRLGGPFRVAEQERFEIGLRLTPDFYLNYILTETNVAAAVRSGVAYEAIRGWCAETLGPVWQGREREVLFRGYYAAMKAGGGRSE